MSVEPELRSFEDRTVLPLLAGVGAAPVRADSPELAPGDLAFLVNGKPRHVDDAVRWRALSVQYCDTNQQVGEVFGFEAELNAGRPYLLRVELAHVLLLTREHERAVWRDPWHRCRLFTFRQDSADKVLLNAWYPFQAVVLPMLYRQSYRFAASEAESVQFRELVLRYVHAAYEGVV